MSAKNRLRRLVLVACALGSAALSAANAMPAPQDPQLTLEQALRGQKIPLTIKVADLTNDYRCFMLDGTLEALFRRDACPQTSRPKVYALLEQCGPGSRR